MLSPSRLKRNLEKEEKRMARNEAHDQNMSRVARELGTALKHETANKWGAVRMQVREEDRRHAWRFRSDSDGSQRFLRVTHKAMSQSDNPVPMLIEQLQAGRWLDRLQGGPETSLVLFKDGRLEARARS